MVQTRKPHGPAAVIARERVVPGPNIYPVAKDSFSITSEAAA
jgi:hypothetical protein